MRNEVEEEEIIDEWTNGLQMRLPHIYNRLERFLNECARAAGHERIPPEPERPTKAQPRKNEVWMNKLHARRDAQKTTTDARNLQIIKDILQGTKTIETVLKETGLISEYSLYNTLKATHLRKGYGENEYLYLEYTEWRKKYMREKTKQKKEEKKRLPTMIWDGEQFIEIP